MLRTTGTAGVEAVTDLAPDAVILDVMLPGIDGFEVLKQIRKASNVPVLMLTALGDEADRIVGLEIGADDYVPKPVNPRELLARIRSVLRRTRPTPGAPQADGGEVVFGPFTLDLGRRELTRDGALLRLQAVAPHRTRLAINSNSRERFMGSCSEMQGRAAGGQPDGLCTQLFHGGGIQPKTSVIQRGRQKRQTTDAPLPGRGDRGEVGAKRSADDGNGARTHRWAGRKPINRGSDVANHRRQCARRTRGIPVTPKVNGEYRDACFLHPLGRQCPIVLRPAQHMDQQNAW